MKDNNKLHPFFRRYIHTGFDMDNELNHPLKGRTGYLVQCYNYTTAGFDGLFVPDISMEEFCHIVFTGENGPDAYEDLFDLYDCHYRGASEMVKEMLHQYVIKKMPIHDEQPEGFIPCMEVDTFMELEDYTTYRELWDSGEPNPLGYIQECKKNGADLHYNKDGDDPVIKIIDGVPYGRQSSMATWQWQLDHIDYARLHHYERSQ